MNSFHLSHDLFCYTAYFLHLQTKFNLLGVNQLTALSVQHSILLIDICIYYSPAPHDENGKVFSLSPRSLGVRNGGAATSHHLAVTPLKVKQKEDTMYTISMRSNSMESVDKSSDQQARAKATHLEIMPKVNQETRGIAALAAAKKRRQQQSDVARLALTDSKFNRTFISSYGDDLDSRLTPSRLASHNLKYGSQYNLNDDADSLTDQRSLKTDPTHHYRLMGASPMKSNSRVPRATKYRPQPLSHVPNQHMASQSDRMSDKTSDTPSKVEYYSQC